MSVQLQDLELLEELRDFTLAHTHPEIQSFKPAMRDWGDQWIEMPANSLPAAGHLAKLAEQPDCHPLLCKFAAASDRLNWEQSYRRDQKLVPDAMLDGYGFVEIIGKRGPFVSESIRAGIGIWGPRIDYPRHSHKAEEIYLVLAGSGNFDVGDEGPRLRVRDDVVHVPSYTPHGFSTADDRLAVLYLWQAGDLREQSKFG